MNKNIKKKNITNEDLALMIAKGFGDVDKRFEEIDKRFLGVDGKFNLVDEKFKDLEGRLSQKIEGLSNRIDDMIFNRPTREEMFILVKRVEKLENKIGIKNQND